MRKCRFQEGTVCHDRTGQIRQIFFTEKGQRDLTELFCQRNSADAAFNISRQIGGIVLKPCNDKYEKQRDHTADNVKNRLFCVYASI